MNILRGRVRRFVSRLTPQAHWLPGPGQGQPYGPAQAEFVICDKPIEDPFGPLKLVDLQRVEALVPPVEVVFFLERADVREFIAHVAEMPFQGGWRGTLVMAGHGGIVPQMAGARTRG